VGIAAVALLAAGATAGAVLLAETPPSSVTAPDGPRTAPVTVQTYDGTKHATATPRLAEPVALTLAGSGRVRSSACAPGAVIASGSSPFILDDRPVLALATAQPLWRDLDVGVRGQDVADLQTELTRLGYDVTADGVFGQGTRTAVRALLTSIGLARPSGALAASDVIWLPVTVTTCELGVGDVAGGGAVATVGGGLVALEIGGTDPVDGWVARWQGTTAPIGEDRRVTDAAFLQAVSSSPLYEAVVGDGGGTLDLELALAEPLQVAVVPPAALFALAGDRGCLLAADGDVRPVRVVSSALGQTLVVVDGEVPSEVSLDPDDDLACP
jgi:peptidoglycan hydrolase-like protein with peptidoglycan-binding domain